MRYAMPVWYATSIVLVAALSAAPAGAAQTRIALTDFGYRGAVPVANRPLSLYVPTFARTRFIRAHLTFASLARATRLHASVNGRAAHLLREPDGTYLLDAGRLHPGGVQIQVVARGADCEVHPAALSAQRSYIEVGTVSHRVTPSSFFNDYRGRIHFVLPKHASAVQARALVQSAYFLHQQQRWRRWHIDAGAKRAPDALNIVVGAYRHDLFVRGGTLFATAHGLHVLDERASDMLAAADELGDAAPPGGPNRRTLADLGVSNARVPISVPLAASFDLAQFGGLVRGLQARLLVAHDPLPASVRTADVFLNGERVNSFALSGTRGVETLDVPIDVDRLAGSNALTVAFAGARCVDGAYASLLRGSSFVWKSAEPISASVGEFFTTVNGVLYVVLDSPRHAVAAVALMDALGASNTQIAQIRFAPSLDDVPPRSYAIVLGPAQRGTEPDGVVTGSTSDGSGFALVHVLKDRMGIAVDDSDEASLRAIGRVDPLVYLQAGPYFIVSRTGFAYLAPPPQETHHYRDRVRESMPELATLFGVSIAAGIVLLTLRRYTA